MPWRNAGYDNIGLDSGDNVADLANESGATGKAAKTALVRKLRPRIKGRPKSASSGNRLVVLAYLIAAAAVAVVVWHYAG